MNHCKVCIITTVHGAFDPRIFHKEVRALAEAGYKVALIGPAPEASMVEGVRIVPLAQPHSRVRRMLGQSWKAFRLAQKEKALIYHFHDPELLPAAVLLKLTTKGKIIYDVHEDVRRQVMSKPWIPRYLRRPVALLYGMVEQLCMPWIDRLILAEESYRETYRNSKRAEVVRNFPSLAWMSGTGNVTYQREGLFTIVYAGAITEHRGLWEVLEAFRLFQSSACPQATLYLLGNFQPPTLAGRTSEWIKSNGLSSNVVVAGFVPHEEVPQYLSRSHVGVALLHPEPNYTDSLPTKLFEYFAFGLPVIASSFPLWKEVIDSNDCGLAVDPKNPNEIASAMAFLYHNAERREKMGENGRLAVAKKYSWESERKKLLDIYEALEAKPRAGQEAAQ